jgi:hypothetical protein
MKSKNSGDHLLLEFKFLFSRNCYGCPLWIYISDTDQAKMYSVLVPAACLEARRPRRPTSSRPDMVLGQLKNLQCTGTCSLPGGKEAQEAHQQLA